jgi:CheY-like chemotaxis protein
MSAPVLAYLDHEPGGTPAWRPSPADAPGGGREGFVAPARILVADDEPMVRRYVARLLEERGHTVQQTVNGGQALQAALTDPIGFDLVIADVRMPVMDGWRLGRELGQRRPELPVLYISGYDEEAVSRAGVPFLRKPFDDDELLERVTRLLRGA